MSGRTLIDTSVRNEVLGFLQEIAQTSSVPNQAIKANELYNQMKPKFIKKSNTSVIIYDQTNQEFLDDSFSST